MHCAVPRVATKPDLYCIRNAQVQDEKIYSQMLGLYSRRLIGLVLPRKTTRTYPDPKDIWRWNVGTVLKDNVIRSKTGESLYIAETHYKQALLYPHLQPQFLSLPTNRARQSFLYLWATQKQYAGYSAEARGQATTSICHAVPLGEC